MLYWSFALLTLAALASAANVKLTDCNKSGKPSHAVIRKFEVSPYPIKFPGKLSWKLEADLLKNLTSVSMSLKIVRETFLLDLTLPCVDHIGSCEYPKMCSFVADMINEDWAGIGATIGKQLVKEDQITDLNGLCGKVLPMQTFVKDTTVDVPELPSILSFIVEGDYTARLELIDTTDNSVIICTEAELNLEDDSSGLWGKRRRRLRRNN